MSTKQTVDSFTNPQSEGRNELDPSLYALDDRQAPFFKSQIGIQDDEELKQHIIAVQRKAYEIWSFPCIFSFSFLELSITQMSIYPQLLQLGKTHEGAIFLDLACCFANDARAAVSDGFPVQKVLCSDLHSEFWRFGHELFKTTPETFPAVFMPGDVFDSNFLSPRGPFYEPILDSTPPSLKSLVSLTPLQGHISAINVSRLFHLFDESQQLLLAKLVATLLSPVPGSMIFGTHAGTHQKGPRAPNHPMFCHSPDSWKDLWDGTVFRKGSVKVEAELRTAKSANRNFKFANSDVYYLWWSVTRL